MKQNRTVQFVNYQTPHFLSNSDLGGYYRNPPLKQKNSLKQPHLSKSEYENNEENLLNLNDFNNIFPSNEPEGSHSYPKSSEGNMKCDCGESAPCSPCDKSEEPTECVCAKPPEMKCPVCNVGKVVREIHENAEREAKSIEMNNDALIKESELQSKLFQQVKKYAQAIGTLEQKARGAAVQLQLYTNKANVLKEKMIKAQKQARALAMRTVENSQKPNNLGQISVKIPSISIKTKGKGNGYDMVIKDNEYSVLDDLDYDFAANDKSESSSSSSTEEDSSSNSG